MSDGKVSVGGAGMDVDGIAPSRSKRPRGYIRAMDRAAQRATDVVGQSLLPSIRSSRAAPRRPRPVHQPLLAVLAAAVTTFADASADRRTEPPNDVEERSIVGIRAAVEVSFDRYAVPVIVAETLEDAVFLQGYLHARDRFVAMDLARRFAAGELAEVIGPLALGQDEGQRLLQGRSVARAALAALRPDDRAVLDAYTDGVNAGLASLDAPAPEYRFLQLAPKPWVAEDSFLIGLSIAQLLTDSGKSELAVAAAVELLPSEWIDFLRSPASRWTTTVLPETAPPPAPAIPGPAVLDVRSVADAGDADASPNAMAGVLADEWALDARPGSNSWVVRTEDGRALLANDMHLPLTVPFVWYRVSLSFNAEGPDGAERRVRLDGLSLPGVPAIIAGSNGDVAWGFTNVEGDFIDYVVVEVDPADPGRYLVPGGSEPFTVVEESIAVRGGEPKRFTIRKTRWGPIVAQDALGRPLAFRWSPLDPGGLNMALLDLATAATVDEALDIAAGWRGAPQNVTVADRHGRIGWTMSGHLPLRTGFDGLVPTSWADGSRGWTGSLDGPARPRLVDPPSGRIVTANQRTLPADQAARIGPLFAEPDRAARIEARLVEHWGTSAADAALDEATLAAIQLDTTVERLARWRDLLVPALRNAAAEQSVDGTPTEQARRAEALAELLAAWSGKADADERAVAIVDRARRFIRLELDRALFAAAAAKSNPGSTPEERSALAQRLGRVPALDERYLEIVEARPIHLLPSANASWDALLVRRTIEAAAQTKAGDSYQRWGRVNASDFGHPLAQAMPLLATKFGIPSHDQPGHVHAVRVATPRFGASNRMVIQPGREERGLMQVPGGQSADPASPHYADLHTSWREGVPLPLQPTEFVSRVRFAPQRDESAE